MRDDDLLKLLNSRIRLSSNLLQAFEGLFYPPPPQETLMSFVSRANGSPGTIVKLAHQVLENHIRQHPESADISPEALLE